MASGKIDPKLPEQTVLTEVVMTPPPHGPQKEVTRREVNEPPAKSLAEIEVENAEAITGEEIHQKARELSGQEVQVQERRITVPSTPKTGEEVIAAVKADRAAAEEAGSDTRTHEADLKAQEQKVQEVKAQEEKDRKAADEAMKAEGDKAKEAAKKKAADANAAAVAKTNEKSADKK